MNELIENKIVLVTGGCGSIGSEIVRQVLAHNPTQVRIFDNCEQALFQSSQTFKDERVRFLLGDVRDRDRLDRAVRGVDILFHAAALKHVPLCESNPFEAVETNIIGTQNILEVTANNNISLVVSISTDKAANPVNTMGATKLISEKLIATYPFNQNRTKVCSVRFGNVLMSKGSVIPTFLSQIKSGGPVTVTDPEMTRFCMTISQAVALVIKCGMQATHGETFILKMPSLNIQDLAEVMVEKYAGVFGHESSSIKIQTIGIRPGEKIHEILVTPEETMYVKEKDDMYVLSTVTCGEFNYSSVNSGNIKLMSKKEISDKLDEIIDVDSI